MTIRKLTFRFFALLSLVFVPKVVFSQLVSLSGHVFSDKKPLEYVSIFLVEQNIGAVTDSSGFFELKEIPTGNYTLQVSAIGFQDWEKKINLQKSESINIDLTDFQSNIKEVVITGTLKEVDRTESLVPVEVYNPAFFKKNPTANIYDALQNINGIRPQLNCNICNTGDIHINGMEGPYTMVLIDGMPIVSSLATVYGLSGIPNSLVERMEIVKGPASSLYGSEAVGGLINIITKKTQNAPIFSADFFATSSQEYNTDIGFKINLSKKISLLTGVNYFYFENKIDKNNDNFTDMTLQNRISVFQKWNINRKNNRQFSVAARYMYEDRWGGEMQWTKAFRGGDSIYGESIYTERMELIGNYQLPIKEKMMLSFSYNRHHQDSRYGTMDFTAQQNITFSQLTWDKKLGKHDLLAGAAIRYTFYDDNTVATDKTQQNTLLPGIFVQDEIALNPAHKFLLGLRYDYHSYHGNILTPRFAYKFRLNEKNNIRLNVGTGFRVVNIFTEDHAALTGARMVVIEEALNPEKSYNININYTRKFCTKNGIFIGLETSIFYTYFNNRIIADYEQDPNKIIYHNLQGFAENKGISINTDIVLNQALKLMLGATLMENSLTENGIKTQQILTERFSGNWTISYQIPHTKWSIDYTGNLYSPMRLPLLGEKDPRKAYSPWWSIQNLQTTCSKWENWELYGGVKNFLNWTPFREKNPFIIARSHDPFDKNVQFDANGQVIANAENPYGLTFDAAYIYAPLQGARAFLGLRWNLK